MSQRAWASRSDGEQSIAASWHHHTRAYLYIIMAVYAVKAKLIDGAVRMIHCASTKNFFREADNDGTNCVTFLYDFRCLSLVHNVAYWGATQLRDAAELELCSIFCQGAVRHPNAQHCELGFSRTFYGSYRVAAALSARVRYDVIYEWIIN